MARVLHGDCIALLREMPAASIDSVVCDPPYELGFMGKSWDCSGIAYSVEVWREVLRVLKPGGHLLAFGGTRTQHRMVCAIEDAGFEIRDMLAFIHGMGFPKSLNVGKAIDRHFGAVREVVGRRTDRAATPKSDMRGGRMHAGGTVAGAYDGSAITAPATPEATQWDGWGSALKPSIEPICLARKPLDGTIAGNVLKHGVGGLNIDATRIAHGPEVNMDALNRQGAQSEVYLGGAKPGDVIAMYKPGGRWPANVLFSHNADCDDGNGCAAGCAVAELDRQSGESVTPASTTRGGNRSGLSGLSEMRDVACFGDTGTASRFFYVAKPSVTERELGCEHLPLRQVDDSREPDAPGANNPRNRGGNQRRNGHPTVKSIDLMRYLCRLVTPPGATILDPFCGSGTTGVAAVLEGFSFVGCELDTTYVTIAEARIAAAHAGQFITQKGKTEIDPTAHPAQGRLF